jgi:hypothetical protein
MSSSGQVTPKFIKLTLFYRLPEVVNIRINLSRIFMYGTHHAGGSYIMFDSNWDNHWRVNETPDEIDQLIKEINNGA